MEADIRVAELHYYPIKSCGAIAAKEVAINNFGIVHDREWMLVSPKGQLISQRTHPKLAAVQTRIEDDHLIAAAPGVGELPVPLTHKHHRPELVPVNPWKKSGSGVSEGRKAARFFSAYLGRDVRLIRVAEHRPVDRQYHVAGASNRIAFADGFPLLLASNDSLSALNQHLDQPIAADRFRPNIVVEGGEPYDEDYWRKVQIGRLQAFVVRANTRCPVPHIDQIPDSQSGPRPVARALQETRRGIDAEDGLHSEFFAQNLVHIPEPDIVVRVGDPVAVIQRAEERNWLSVSGPAV